RPVEVDGRLDAAAFHRNHEPIWSVLQRYLAAKSGDVLEAGSGTGQHAVYFARQSPDITWWPSDFNERHLASITAWRAHAGPSNRRPPFKLDLTDPAWCEEMRNGGGPTALLAVFCANVIHIAPGTSPRVFSRAPRAILGATATCCFMDPSSATASTPRSPMPCLTQACAKAIPNGACATRPISKSSGMATALPCAKSSRYPPTIWFWYSRGRTASSKKRPMIDLTRTDEIATDAGVKEKIRLC